MKQIKSLNLTYFFLVILYIIVSLLILTIDTAPFVIIGLLWFALILFLSFRSKRNFIRLMGIYICTVILALTAFEAYQWFKTGEFFITKKTSYDPYKIDKFLGYVPVKNSKITETKYYKDKLVFDVTYTIDKNGLRISPTYNETNIKRCALFFGCSFTFGLGVNDSETMPYQVGIKSHGEYRIYNFGLGGYGPHQMLSELEHNIVKNVVDCNRNIYAIYQAIPSHIDRASGLSFWDYYGPRYVLGKNGDVKFAGNFNEAYIFPKIIIKYLNKSLLYRDIIGNKNFLNRDKDLELFERIIYAAKKNFEKLYPDGKFHVIYWNNRFKSDEKLEKKLEQVKLFKYFKNKGINVHLISDILPDYQNNRSKYTLDTYDAHPNALAHRLIAEYVVNNILRE